VSSQRRYRLTNIKFLPSPDVEKERVGPRVPSTGAAHLTERDNRLARSTAPDIGFEDYKDWPDFRAGAFFGLEIAGFTEELVAVDLTEFAMCGWTTSTLPSLEALDRFARRCERRAYIQHDEQVVLHDPD